MSTTARAGFMLAAVAVLVAAFLLLRPGEDPAPAPTAATPTASPTPTPSPTATEPGGTATATPTSTPTPRPTVDPGPLLTSAGVREIRVKKGETVRFRARSSTDEEIHVHGYDLTKAVKPGQTARMSFKATIDGIFEIEFEHSGTPIARLRVDP